MFRPRSRASLEIVAVFVGTVLDVRHLRPKQPRAAGQILGIVGGVFLVVGGGLLLSGQRGVGLGLGLIALVSLAVAFVKASDSDTCSYTIGEGPGFGSPRRWTVKSRWRAEATPCRNGSARAGRSPSTASLGPRSPPELAAESSMEISCSMSRWSDGRLQGSGRARGA